MKMTWLPRIAALALLLTAFPLPAQTVTGSVTGEVTDPSGALIPHAQVTARNVATGVETQSETNASGVYSIRFLPIGQYQVTVNSPGFAAQTFAPFTLEIDQTVKLNPHLAVGASATVEVDSGAAAILDTNDATLGSTFTANTIENLPLNGLDFSALTLYLPGLGQHRRHGRHHQYRAQHLLDGHAEHERQPRTSEQLHARRDRHERDLQQPHRLLAPRQKPCGEVKVLTANSPQRIMATSTAAASSACSSPAPIGFHGSALRLLTRTQNFNANTWQNKNQTTGRSPKTNFSHRSQFGGSLGGPICFATNSSSSLIILAPASITAVSRTRFCFSVLTAAMRAR